MIKHILFVLTFIHLTSFSQVQKGQTISNQFGSDRDFFGHRVSMANSSTIAISGQGFGNYTGQVRIYELSGSSWLQKGQSINGENVGDQFGRSISMGNVNTFAVGAPFNGGNGNSSGHVRIFEWSGSTWTQKGTDIDGDTAYDQSGYSVSMPNANIVAIGAINNNNSNGFSGHVRIFRWNGSSWTQKGTDIDGKGNLDQSGFSVSMPDSNTVAIGSPYSNNGHVSIFQWNGSSWTQKGMDIVGDAYGDEAGYSISMPDSNTIAIGSPDKYNNGIDGGQVRVFEWNGSSWTQKGANIDGSNFHNLRSFGKSLSMPNPDLVAIAYSNTPAKVDIYKWNGSSWIQKGLTIQNSDLIESVSMPDSNTIGFGSPDEDCFWGLGYYCGEAKVYEFPNYSSLMVNDINSNFSIYPNPVTDEFVTINFHDFNPNCSIELKDVTGKIISKTIRIGEETIELSLDRKKGIYLLTITTNSESYTTKILKQ